MVPLAAAKTSPSSSSPAGSLGPRCRVTDVWVSHVSLYLSLVCFFGRFSVVFVKSITGVWQIEIE